MRIAALLVALALPAVLFGQEAARFGVALDAANYPQATPQEAFASVLKAAQQNRITYLVAHLADPAFIDERVEKLYGGKFAEQVADTAARLDPGTLKLLQRLAKEAEWNVADKEAILTTKAIENRSVYMKKVGDRWFLQNKQSP